MKKGDQIIVSPRSFIISASCTLNLGLEPVFADVDDNGNLSIDGIKKIYNKNIKALIIVHLNGLSCDLDPIMKFVKKNKIFLIEDCSQAHGAVYKGKKLGHLVIYPPGLFVRIKLYLPEVRVGLFQQNKNYGSSAGL